MKKKKLIIFMLIEIIFLSVFILLMSSTQAKAELAKLKLEKAVNESYISDNKVDIQALKNNIEKGINNAKVVNKETLQFPVQAVVDGYEFEVEENGNIKNDEKDNPIVEENIPNDEIKKLVHYSNDIKTDRGITVSTTEDGLITINGKSTDNLYIKISNNIQISNKTVEFEKWKQEDGIIIEQGKNIKQKITMLNNSIIKGQVNIALRNENNEAIGIIKLKENQTDYIAALNQNIIANYIYIDKGVEADNIQFKIEVIEEPIKHEIIEFRQETKEDKGIECSIDEDGIITLNGTAKDNIYIKVSNGMNITSNGNENILLATTQPILFNTEEKINININELSGKYLIDDVKQEINLVLKYQDGIIASNCKLKEKIFNKQIQSEKNITMVYLYVSKGIKLENYKIKVDIENNKDK